MIQWMLAIWSLVPLPFLKPAWIFWILTVHILLKPGLENFKHYFTGLWDECNCAVVWTFFGIAFLWDWNENLSFPVVILTWGKKKNYKKYKISVLLFYHHPFPPPPELNSVLIIFVITKHKLNNITLNNMPVSLSKSLSHVKLFVTSWTVVHQAPLYKEFSWQEYWSGLPLVSSRYPTNTGIKPISLAFQEDFFFLSCLHLCCCCYCC